MAALAVHAKSAPNAWFLPFLRRIEATARVERHLVKRGANWALRQIAKRNARLHAAAMATARRIGKQASPSARWIASDAVRELQRPGVKKRLAKRA
jgi:3-methyladenine DNA glycosylase AlkD